ncbi:MAG: 3-isopropylmalate dehydratase small subunit [Deltaproteobacteria bacterium]|jgi:3-isopropylmalate/(R)-2-methylmalate dehydratase small subunit|nr:3-isopropylmalate dehydratase small subunit [Deltaproteobacteria bacterium]
MEAFKTRAFLAAVLDRPNVDTDLIIPKQFLTRIERSGYGRFLFHDLRFLDDGRENPDFILNLPRYRGAGLLISRENFGCGSSREHAPWALDDYGLKVIIAPSFGDIFRNNSLKVGLLLIELPNEVISDLMARVTGQVGYQVTVDLAGQALTGSDGWARGFEVEPFTKEKLLTGGDEIAQTLLAEAKIAAYEKNHAHPWEAVLPSNPAQGL